MNEELKKAIAERDKFLEEHPEMREFQNEIDELLDKTPWDSRLATLSFMMVEKLIDLQTNLFNLTGILNGSS